ncbi:MAG: hypothetical protein AAF512_05060 [Pseudomonadota bacterium]
MARTFNLILLCIFITACDGPFFVFPGGELQGTVQTEPVTDWSFLTANYVHLETDPGEPYSVELNYFVRDGMLYIDPAEDRTWYEHLKKNLDVRVRFDDTIYPVKAVLVGKPGELEGFDADRYIYRLDSR